MQAVIPSVVAAGGFAWGIHTYRRGQDLKRKEILFSLIEEFDKSQSLDLAKKILDDFSYIRLDGDVWLGWYNKASLDTILRYHTERIFNWNEVPGNDEANLRRFLSTWFKARWVETAALEKMNDNNSIKFSYGDNSVTVTLNEMQTGAEIRFNPTQYPYGFIVEKKNGVLKLYRPGNIIDQKEIEIRDSFSALLDFFGKLGYLLDRGLVKKEELRYFEYYIIKAREDDAVKKFAEEYHFDLYRDLLRKLD
jgi:hypothetical protein